MLDGVAELIAAGDDVTFAKAAAAAGVPERTVYRHFPTARPSGRACSSTPTSASGSPARCRRTGAEMTAMVQPVFPGFDAVAPVVAELLASPEGRRARLGAVDERRAAARDVVATSPSGPRRRDRAGQLAAVVQVLGTAAVWQALRDFWALDGARRGRRGHDRDRDPAHPPRREGAP